MSLNDGDFVSQYSALRHRAAIKRIKNLHQRYGVIVSSNYDIADECNLTCEGCLYFAGLNYRKRTPASVEQWEEFFRHEAESGVNFGYFAGAEPSLVQDVLRAALKHISHGVVFSNGIKPIPKDIPYRIHLSVWGNQEDGKSFRGADNSIKALKNYRGDPRAIAVYTINRRNIAHITEVSKLCADHGIPITFSYFSPTDDYLSRVSGEKRSESLFFRGFNTADLLVLSQNDFLRAHEEIVRAKETLPEWVWYSLDYDRWVGRPEGLYQLDEQGVAVGCVNRASAGSRHYNVDLSLETSKCCSPNIDCRECRAYAQSYATLLSRLKEFRRDTESLEMWLEAWELWLKLFIFDQALLHAPAIGVSSQYFITEQN